MRRRQLWSKRQPKPEKVKQEYITEIEPVDLLLSEIDAEKFDTSHVEVADIDNLPQTKPIEDKKPVTKAASKKASASTKSKKKTTRKVSDGDVSGASTKYSG